MNHISIKKGHNIKIRGCPDPEIITIPLPDKVSICPNQFRGVKPKLIVKEGDDVKIGSPLFFDKLKPQVMWPSPASGKITEIKYGERRVIDRIEIFRDDNLFIKRKTFSLEDIKKSDRKTIINQILEANLFPLIRQRPFNKVADPNQNPRDIFISGHNSAPLAVDLFNLIDSNKNIFQIGLTALSRLTNGSVYLTLNKHLDFDDVICQSISGPHPSGNVGIQIHHTKPLCPGDIVWSVDAQHVLTLGRLFQLGKYDPKIIVTIGGSGSTNPITVETIFGASISSLISTQAIEKPVRIISGNILTGNKVNVEDYLGFYDSTLSIINDEVKRPFLGMLSPGSSKTKYSLFNTFISFGSGMFNFTTSQNGELRAMVPLNAWEKVLPMDIYPNPLYRAILAKDVEEMEKLGIWECDDEDFALCSFACPSKIDVGAVIRNGLDIMEVEG